VKPYDTDLLIVGAGPFGLATSAYAQHLGIDHLVVGKPMSFWREYMPRGMLLRSACDWHLDPTDVHTIEAYLAETGRRPSDVEPLSLDFYLEYCDWFIHQTRFVSRSQLVARLDCPGGITDAFDARMDDGSTVRVRRVVLAVGTGYFAHIPTEIAALLPPGRYAHTCDTVELTQFAGQRVAIVGGRQSAFEWAALLAEAGAAQVHLTYRHDTPDFTESDWTWVPPLVERICAEPQWYRALSDDERTAIGRRLWGEGRLKLEPWLAPRIDRPNIHLWPRSTIAACKTAEDGSMLLTLDTGADITADFVIFATGYRVDISRVPFLAAGDLLTKIATKDGYPALDEHFETSIPGLYMTSMAAGGDFGPFFGFTVSVRASARAIGDHLAAS
jgi:cation diffusion facilitator CzcD-associated flavoprotein CzcO